MKSHPPSDLASTRRPHHYGPRHHRGGVALIIVLAFIVLLTGVIIAYFSRSLNNRQLSNSSFNQAKSDELARSALDIVTSDLQQEIANGSSASYGAGGSTSYPVVYLPTDPKYMVPQRNGTPPTPAATGSVNPLPTLLRISAPSGGDTSLPATYTQLAAGGPGVDHPAYPNALSTNPSVNGRVVSLARWNQPMLLACANPSDTGADPTPVTQFQAPRWVYVDPTKGPLTPASAPVPTTAIGRYAYAVYDESALLDANVAGLPLAFPTTPAVPGATTMSSAQAQRAGKKGLLGLADLTQLPTATNGGYLTAAQASNLVGWRNYASAQPTGTFGSFVFSGTPMDNYLSFLVPAASPGMSPYPTPNDFKTVNGTPRPGGSGTDQMFLTRQQLLNFQRSSAGGTGTYQFSANALQYLGTFSRAVTAPSWMPSANSQDLLGYSALPNTKNFTYKGSADVNGTANRNMANVRVPTSAGNISINHYKDDGTTILEAVRSGDPYTRHRFSLKKIDWLTHDGSKHPTGITDAMIKDCFGLQWGTDKATPANPCWLYIHGTSNGVSGTLNHILTLDQVAALSTPREPDFFEMLKAAILSGSLGKDPGMVVEDPSYSNNYADYSEGPGGTGFDTTSAVPDMQIIQIGANIIDQWDSDSYPTAIYFRGVNVSDTVPETAVANMAYGIENLPYINRVFQLAWYRNGTRSLDGWLQPELWTPFQIPDPSNSAAQNTSTQTVRPTNLAVRAYGRVTFSWGESWGYPPPDPTKPPPPPPPQPQNNPHGTDGEKNYDTLISGNLPLADAIVYFSDSPTQSKFVNPAILTTDNGGNYMGNSGTLRNTNAINIVPTNHATQGKWSGIDNAFLAIHAGTTPYSWVTNPPPTADDPSTIAWDKATPYGTFLGTNITPNTQTGVSFCMLYHDGTQYLPYSFMSRFVGYYGFSYPVDESQTLKDGIYGGLVPGDVFGHADPLTDRFSCIFDDGSHAPTQPACPWTDGINSANHSWEWFQYADGNGAGNNPCEGFGAEFGIPRTTSGFVNMDNGNTAYHYGRGDRGLFIGNWAQNNISVSYPNTYFIYADPDGVVRPGNDYRWNPAGNSTGTKNGKSLGFANADGMGQLQDGYSTSTGFNGQTTTVGRRLLVLNRPFRSVAEMGYAHRDLPFKSLDMFTPYSADAALLDLFSISDEPTVVAGRVNPNNAPVPVLQAILSGTNKQELDPNYSINTEASALAKNIAATVASSTGTLTNRADLVTKLMDSTKGLPSAFVNSSDQSDKTYLEAPIRALSDVTNTRTWNLVIDVIAQSGQLAPNATKADQFAVQGEKRYWLHVAIDRFTGKVIDQQLEQVSE